MRELVIDFLVLNAEVIGNGIVAGAGLFFGAFALAGCLPSKPSWRPKRARRPAPTRTPVGPLPPASPAPPPPRRMCYGCPACRAEAHTWWEIARPGMLSANQIRTFDGFPPRADLT